MINLKYIPNSKIACVAVEVKLFWFICLSIIILCVGLILTQAIVLLALFSLAYFGGLKPFYIVKILKSFWLIFLIVFILHLFYHDGRSLFRLWLFNATDTGMKAGIFNLLRFLNFIISAICLISWTSPQEIAGMLAAGFGGFKRRFFQELALIFFIAMRFIPVLIREREIVVLAMRARGADFGGRLIHKIRLNLKLMLPLFSRVISQTDDVASALALKGDAGVYFAGTKTKLKAQDILLLLSGFVLTVLAAYYG